ncbi:hypothetical protein GCM10025868_43550 [Angustibacter aerolatus]|uniref:ROK family protein n=1 Tax=Angustibacter aerolatus TaxID=1162965 RepID=A0ABQ6JPB3_9ACTN|nr:hypothetical protein GCM10025868_43550 [Angustibacter aerolatus]
MSERRPEAPLQVWSRPAIGVDIGGTKVAAGLVDTDGRVLSRARRETPHRSTSPQVVEDTIAEVITEPARGVGLPRAAGGGHRRGRVRRRHPEPVLFAPHLSWRHEPLRDAMRRRVGLPVVVENDANAALWAESRFGAAQGEECVVCVNLGTGIGGAVLLDGEPVPRAVRRRGRVRPHAGGGRRAPLRVRQPRVLGAVRQRQRPGARGPRAWRRPGLRWRTGCSSAPRATRRRSTARWSPRRPRTATPRPSSLFEDVGRWLGIGLANLAAAFDPGLFVIGGGVSDAREPAAEPGARVVPPCAHRPRLPPGGAGGARAGGQRGRPGGRGRPRPRPRAAVPPPAAPGPHRPAPSRGPGAVTAAATARLRVVAWNVRDLLDDRHAVAAVLRETAPDVALLQEAPRRFWDHRRLRPVADRAGLLPVVGGRGPVAPPSSSPPARGCCTARRPGCRCAARSPAPAGWPWHWSRWAAPD